MILQAGAPGHRLFYVKDGPESMPEENLSSAASTKEDQGLNVDTLLSSVKSLFSSLVRSLGMTILIWM